METITAEHFIYRRKLLRLSQSESARLSRVPLHRLHGWEHRYVQLDSRELALLDLMLQAEAQRILNVMVVPANF
ncbi:MAG TPA: hypothetical protein VGN17_24755 [Bryobacteraceae bacterium]|jgi:DNA-binding transcriptional regulator YiaG